MPPDVTIQPITVPLAMDADGVVRVRGSRVTLEVVVETFEEGATAEEIVQQYPSLQLGDVYAIISYYLSHQEPVREYMAERARISGEVKKQNELRDSPVGIRERLLARRTAG